MRSPISLHYRELPDAFFKSFRNTAVPQLKCPRFVKRFCSWAPPPRVDIRRVWGTAKQAIQIFVLNDWSYHYRQSRQSGRLYTRRENQINNQTDHLDNQMIILTTIKTIRQQNKIPRHKYIQVEVVLRIYNIFWMVPSFTSRNTLFF